MHCKASLAFTLVAMILAAAWLQPAFGQAAESYIAANLPEAAPPAQAAVDLRIDTDIYSDLKQRPIKGTTTIFRGGVVYDYGDDPKGIVTIVDSLRGRVVLLDGQRSVKLTVPIATLWQRVSDAQAAAPSAMRDIDFNAWGEAESGPVYRVGNRNFHYEVIAADEGQPGAAGQYAQFAEAISRLNAVLPPYLPPYIRSAMNSELATQRKLPVRIKRVAERSEVWAVLTPIWRLSDDDLQRIRESGSQLANFREVGESEFYPAPAQ